MDYYYQEILELLLNVQQPIRQRSGAAFLLFRELLKEATADAGVNLPSTFAQLHYLYQHHAQTNPLFYAGLNDYRVRMRHLSETSDEELKRNFIFDMLRLARMVEWIKGTCIPEELKLRLPQLLPEVKRKKGEYVGDFRVLVLHKDEKSLRVQRIKDDHEFEILMLGERPDEPDFSKLLPLIHDNMQLNLVACRHVGERIVPTFIILEPDYLVNVTSVASCFQVTGASSQYEFIHRLSSAPEGASILLGNLAGQMLDEELHGGQSTYAETVQRFFAQNAVQCYTCDDLRGDGKRRDFHINAQQQQQHLRQMVEHQLHDDLHLNAVSDILLEPTFFCELLGLQGRMDLLSRDLSTVIEQKSGKMNEWDRRAMLPHNIQIQLYRAILHYALGVNFTEMQAYLLYSRYAPSEGLLRIETVPRLLHDALQVRNEIVARDIQLSADDVRTYLDDFDVDTFYHGGCDKLWRQYVRPRLEEFIEVYRKSDELSRCYFARFYRFLMLERKLGMVGSQLRECSGFASAWSASFEEKLEVGSILAGLRLQDEEGCVCNAGGAVERLQFVVPTSEERVAVAPNFREGDIVVLYSYEEHRSPDMRKGLVMRATILSLNSEKLVLQLRAPQTNPTIFDIRDGQLWALEKDFMDAASSSLFRGIYALLGGQTSRKEWLLHPENAKVDEQQTLMLKHANDELDQLVLKAKKARDCFLLVGPPGTGKTSFGLMSILREELASDTSCNVLLAAYTNRAVDEICSKLKKDGLDFLRLGNKHSCDTEYQSYLLENRMTAVTDVGRVDELMHDMHIFVGTVSSLSSMTSLLAMKHFSLAIVDESSQLLEPHLLPLLLAEKAGSLAIDRFVLIGDYKQLPSVVQQTERDSRVEEPELRAIGLHDCRHSLFERLYHALPRCCIHEFTKQGRMHPEVAKFANEQFYDGQLRDYGLEHQRRSIEQPRVLFYPCVPDKDTRAQLLNVAMGAADIASITDPSKAISMAFEEDAAGQSSEISHQNAQALPSTKVNVEEAKLIVRLAEECYEEVMKEKKQFDEDNELGIIVPYRHQIAMVRNLLLQSHFPELSKVTIDTVERFQGSEKNVIIYGFTVSRPSQLSFLCDTQFRDVNGKMIDRKLNVALTRARERTLLVGNPDVLRQVPLFAQLIDEVPKGHL